MHKTSNWSAERIHNEVDQILRKNELPQNKLLEVIVLLKNEVPYYNWVGYYILEKETNTLILGPYIGAQTDHTRIPVGRGVCGQVAEKNETMVVQDVSLMDNYLSCSLDVKSEIVIPIQKNGEFVAQLDIDSHAISPFSSHDTLLLEEICTKLSSLF